MDRPAQAGFSLVELMMALMLSSVLIVSMYSTFVQQQRTTTRQEHTTEANQIARLSMDAMLTELRGAGFDPDGSAGAGIVEAKSTRMRFTRDLNCNGTLADVNGAVASQGERDRSDEDVAYVFDAQAQVLGRIVHANGAPTGGRQPVASNILNVDFCYFLHNSLNVCVPNPTTLSDIRAVQVTMTARAAAPDPHYTDPQVPPNSPLKHYHKATQTSLLRLRNLGIKRGDPLTIVPFNDPCPLR